MEDVACGTTCVTVAALLSGEPERFAGVAQTVAERCRDGASLRIGGIHELQPCGLKGLSVYLVGLTGAGNAGSCGEAQSGLVWKEIRLPTGLDPAHTFIRHS
ncbi:hypothetical protein EYF80_026107 [Liparis tanakae]|uniref:Uncharacterized protein n=1 Tax=Liparis tanakae TaxID=230148 RepID=A0A4Z2HCX9_9TELE|nr:hypothetical protein EYF80_026107 [Liparis tanakae]